MEFSTRDIPFERCTIKAQIWDTVGQERFESLTKAYFRDAVGALLVYDVTNKQSYENVKNIWLKQLRDFGHERLQIVLVGNKLDNDDTAGRREVDASEAIEFAKENRMDFAEVSALSNSKVECVFRRVVLSVAPVIPDINSHLGLTGLPDGWIHLSQTQAQPALNEARKEEVTIQARADQPLIVNDKDASGDSNVFDSTADYFMNYWTGEITRTVPTQSAEAGLLYAVDLRLSTASTSFYARGSLNMGSNRADWDTIRMEGEEDGDDVDVRSGKCYCNIL